MNGYHRQLVGGSLVLVDIGEFPGRRSAELDGF